MNKRRSHLRWAGIVVTVIGIMSWGLGSQPVSGQKDVPDPIQPDVKRADIIAIDGMKIFGDLERPPVVFLHDAHVDALEKQNKDCATCHLSEKDRLSPKFKRLADTGKNNLMDIYHDNCLGCHKEMADLNQKTGPPEECGYCHQTEPRFTSNIHPPAFDKSLHFRHTKAQEDKCDRCHHEYDEAQKALIYVKDREGTCRYCHGAQTVENRIAMRLAAHLSCIDCHQKTLAKKISAGPVQCGGCHDPMKQKMIKKITPVPRMVRKQPDKVYIKKEKRDPYVGLDTYLKSSMARVPFDHRQHEEKTATCYQCHHANLSACNDCHTLAGTKEGDNVKLEQAMHQTQSGHSCIGCHGTQQTSKECNGCHRFLSVNRPKMESDCVKCHNGPLPAEGTLPLEGPLPLEGTTPDDAITEPLVFNEPEQMAVTDKGIADEDIPEIVIIKGLTHTYEPVELPHRKIVRSIEQKIGENTLAGHFHQQKETLCQGCHHNSPAVIKPPRCASCHGLPFDEDEPFKPGLMAAYHSQCMGCHSGMGIEKPANTDCVGCHKEKKS